MKLPIQMGAVVRDAKQLSRIKSTLPGKMLPAGYCVTYPNVCSNWPGTTCQDCGRDDSAACCLNPNADCSTGYPVCTD